MTDLDPKRDTQNKRGLKLAREMPMTNGFERERA